MVPVAVAEQVGAGGGRRRGDRRGRQPGAGGGGLEGEDWVAAGGTVSPSLRPPPRQPQPHAERAKRPQLRAERRDGPPRRSLGTTAPASLPPGASAAKREARAGRGSARLPKMAARPRGPSRFEPLWPLRPLVPPADCTSCPSADHLFPRPRHGDLRTELRAAYVERALRLLGRWVLGAEACGPDNRSSSVPPPPVSPGPWGLALCCSHSTGPDPRLRGGGAGLLGFG